MIEPRSLEVWDFAILAAALGALAWFLRRGRAAVSALRAVSFLLALLVFLQPVVERRVRAKGARVAVVVDSSESMSVADIPRPGSGHARRWDAAVERAASIDPESALLFHLDKSLKKIERGDLPAMSPKGRASDLSRLDALARDHRDVRAAFLFSDGRWGGGRDPAAVLVGLGVPVHSVGVGREDTAPDLVLDSVRAPHFAFKKTDVEVTVRVERRNFDLRDTDVRIVQDGQTLLSQPLIFSTAADVTEAALTFQPFRTGPQSFQVRLPVYDAETNRKNNVQSFSMDVSRDRIRVLYITGQPGPQYSFLRHQLKTNPSVELVSFVILRDPQDVVSIPDHQLSLIPFPSQDVLLGQLKSFDVVIFEQFAFSLFGMGAQGMAALREYVERGGGLLLAGNTDVLGPEGPYARTVLEEVLPLALEPPRPGPVRYPLDVGEPEHPVTALAEHPSDTRSAWAQAAPLEGNGWFLPRAKPGATVLATCRASEGNFPVAAAWSRGKGRVMMFLSLTSWRWALEEAGRGRGTWLYQKFWSNALRWLGASDDFRLVRLDLPREAASLGDDLFLRAVVRDENYRPLAAAQVQAIIDRPGGGRLQVPLKSLGRGEYGETFVPEESGPHRVRVIAFHQQKKLGEDAGTFQGGSAWEENRDTGTNFAFLKQLSASTGGEFVRWEDYDEKWFRERVEAAAWDYERKDSPWNSPWVLAALVILLFSEWFLRRRWGQV